MHSSYVRTMLVVFSALTGCDGQVETPPTPEQMLAFNASAKTTQTTGVVRWEIRKSLAGDQSAGSLQVTGISASDEILSDVILGGTRDGSLQISSSLPEQATLKLDSKNNIVLNTFPQTQQTQPFFEAFQADLQDPSLAVPYDCLNDWLNAVGSCGAAISVCFFTAGWGCALGVGFGGLVCIASLRQASLDGCFPRCTSISPWASCPSGTHSTGRGCTRFGCYQTCCA